MTAERIIQLAGREAAARRGRRRAEVGHLLLQPVGIDPGSTLQDTVYELLRNAVMIGAFPPGKTLSSRALAETFETSTMPVKDALRRLAAYGVLHVLPQSGFRVATLSATRFLDLVEARVRLETMAAARAAELRDPALVATLTALNARYRAADTDCEPRGMLLKLNSDFHFAIYRASAMSDVTELIAAAWLRTGPLLSLIEAGLNQQEDFDRHERIIDGLASGDPTAAAAALETDIRATAARIVPLLPS